MIAAKMVDSLLASPVLAGGKKPVLYIHNVRNRTDEHIDTRAVTDKIRVTLLKSGKVRFTAVADLKDEIVRQLEFQRAPARWTRRRPRPWQLVGADYFLNGELSSIRKSAGRVEDVYYKSP
jgi:PBP1b-binding outer membrane lipoprotein LpoB